MTRSDFPPRPEVPRVCVLLASYNGARFIEPQIRSILWQRNVETFVMVRDDGSSDGTRDLVGDLAREFPGRVALFEDGQGLSGSAAQNFFLLLQGVRTDRFDYVALADQDDIWEEGKLTRAVSELRRTGAGGYSSNLLSFDVASGRVHLIRKDWREVPFDHLFQTASAGCTYVLTASLASLIGERLRENAPNPDIAHDILIYAVARSFGHHWVHDREAHILYRQHGENLVGARGGLKGHLTRLRLIHSGWYRQQVAGLAPYLRNNAEERRILDAVSTSSWRQRLWLALNAPKCRRRKREALIFALAQFIP